MPMHTMTGGDKLSRGRVLPDWPTAGWSYLWLRPSKSASVADPSSLGAAKIDGP